MERTVTSGEVRELLETVVRWRGLLFNIFPRCRFIVGLSFQQHVKNKVVRQYREALRIVFEFYRQHTDGEKVRPPYMHVENFYAYAVMKYATRWTHSVGN
eukprot:gb/GECG01015345.1/.p1 GENE.gb/GECG01015345.1/~~gb/GECG01015345.1/.p1  ORF type:complete len:100 (+),score=4.31 gb/GECG01015345.1/:1-300(+)